MDLHVDGRISAMVRYWLGLAEMAHVVRAGTLRITGRRALVRAFPTWFRRSPLRDDVVRV